MAVCFHAAGCPATGITVKWIAVPCLLRNLRPFSQLKAPRSPGGASDRYRLARGAAPKEGGRK